jgi:hypothetical protein
MWSVHVILSARSSMAMFSSDHDLSLTNFMNLHKNMCLRNQSKPPLPCYPGVHPITLAGYFAASVAEVLCIARTQARRQVGEHAGQWRLFCAGVSFLLGGAGWECVHVSQKQLNI